MTHPEHDARMVDISSKDVTLREAVASCVVKMTSATRDSVIERSLEKGDALEVARIAGIMAAKRTAELIPLCHPISLTAIEVGFDEREDGIGVTVSVRTSERTGVEMEAMTAAAIAGLTIYDMVKGTERAVELSRVRLLEKTGGRSGRWEAPEN